MTDILSILVLDNGGVEALFSFPGFKSRARTVICVLGF